MDPGPEEGCELGVTKGLWQKPGSGSESSQSFSESDEDGKFSIDKIMTLLNSHCSPAEYISSVSDYVESELEREGDEGTTDDQTTTQEESWQQKAEVMSEGGKVGLSAELSTLMLNRQELLRQCQLKQHIDKLEEDVQMKEDKVKKFRCVCHAISHHC